MAKATVEQKEKRRISRVHARLAAERDARRIIEAVRDLHSLIYRSSNKSICKAADALHAIYLAGIEGGKEEPGWEGGCLTQADAAMSAIYLLETMGAPGSRFRA
jgi:hypothetical protein